MTSKIKNRDTLQPVLEELVPGSTSLYFLFGGVNAGLGMPPFEFYQSSKIIQENKIFLRDLSQTWYQNGLRGLAKDVFETGAFIQRRIEALAPENLFFVGNSMGGFAAILFAAMTGRGKAIAFAPQTFLSPGLRIRHWDRRWQTLTLKVWLTSGWHRHVYDLRSFLKNRPGGYTADIYVSTNYRRDLAHANRLRDFEQVTVHACDLGGHQLVKHLRDSGQLADILRPATRRG